MKYEETKIRLLESFIRNIINTVVQKIDSEKLENTGQSFLAKTKDRFRFDDNRGLKFLNSSLDVIGDAQFAIVSFEDSKIKNGKEFNTGEQYLRIYGVLSAVYIQQQAIIKLSDLVKINELSESKKEFDKLDITFLRHCISAHPINFEISKKKYSYKIDRDSINDNGNLSIRDEENNAKIYNIFSALEEYKKIGELYLNNIATKLIKNTYKSSEVKKKELLDKLNLIKYGR